MQKRLVMFIVLIPTSYMSAISAFVAQNIGAGQHQRAQRSMWVGMSTAALLGGIMAYLAFFHGDMLSSIFVQDQEVIKCVGISESDSNRMLYPVNRILLYRLLQWAWKDNICHGRRADRDFPYSDTVCLFCQQTAGSEAVPDWTVCCVCRLLRWLSV